ncbi:DinB family protein [Tolypothrix sp. NIES-4075]|uniref:DinB family protein n=1 Tax=Tolypothrix sp. NIES-4075 TaxID=2005459 RepID=UPI000B7496E6|nr:DinB family protein [Tolypothrix sp. NIES-4075]GAX41251.1 DinB family protein [Tolypothrix sp. NIES-4075]
MRIMCDRTYYETMAEYNFWMNQKLYTICAEIPDDKRREDLGAFFKSIHGTLNHLLFGDRAWMGRFIEKPFTAKIGQELYADFNELRQQRELTDKQIIEWSKSLSHEWLNQPFKYTSGVDGKTRILPAWLLVTHMFNHQTHHRGQLTTLLSQLGYDPGITDLPFLPCLNAIVKV